MKLCMYLFPEVTLVDKHGCYPSVDFGVPETWVGEKGQQRICLVVLSQVETTSIQYVAV